MPILDLRRKRFVWRAWCSGRPPGLRGRFGHNVPPGFQHDQMFNSLDALSIGSGRPAFPLYFPANFGREALGIYPVALIFKLAGGHYVWSLRFTSVLWGMAALSLTIVLALTLYAASRRAGCRCAACRVLLVHLHDTAGPGAGSVDRPGDRYDLFLGRGLANHTWRDFAAAGLARRAGGSYLPGLTRPLRAAGAAPRL